MRRRASGRRALAPAMALIAACSSPPPPAASASPQPAACSPGRVVACECRAGKGYRGCADGEWGDCICHRGQQAGLSDKDIGPPTHAELAQYTRDLTGAGPLRVVLRTSMGDIDCALFPEAAPLTVANFVGLARGLKAWRHPATGGLERRPYYDGLTFHRVVSNFIIQTGDPLDDGTGGPGYLFGDETGNGLSHDGPGTLAMANRNQPNTNGSQFYITLGAFRRLDATNTVFGKCDDLDVIRAIGRVAVAARDRPSTPVILEQVRIYRRSPK